MRHINTVFWNLGDNNIYNLHNHTRYSDWEHTPSELISEAREKLITVLSITDHDTIKAYTEWNALEIAKNHNIKLLPWVEATVKWHNISWYTAHLLMYFNEKLLKDKWFITDFDDTIWQARTKKTLELRLSTLNNVFWLSLTLNDFVTRAKDDNYSNINGFTIKQVIWEKYPNIPKQEIEFMLSSESPGDVDMWTEINDLSYLKFKYDLVTVLAHPILKKNVNNIEMTNKTLDFIDKLTFSWIVDWLEIYHPDVIEASRTILKQFNLALYTAWSDTHYKKWLKKTMYNTWISEVINKDFNTLNKKSEIAVMIWRLNPPHIWHIRIIKKALSENDKVVLFLGSANVVDEKNPFTFEQRKIFLTELFKDELESWKLILSYLDDVNDDWMWIENMWEKLKEVVSTWFEEINVYWWDFKEDRAITVIKEYENRLWVDRVKYTKFQEIILHFLIEKIFQQQTWEVL